MRLSCSCGREGPRSPRPYDLGEKSRRWAFLGAPPRRALLQECRNAFPEFSGRADSGMDFDGLADFAVYAGLLRIAEKLLCGQKAGRAVGKQCGCEFVGAG